MRHWWPEVHGPDHWKLRSAATMQFHYEIDGLRRRVIIIIIIIIRHAPCQCVAPLTATNSLHSDLSMASSIASSKVRLCRDRSLFKVAIQEVKGRPTGLLQSLWWTPVRILLASAVSSILAKWPNSMSLLFCMISVRGGCSVIHLTSRSRHTTTYRKTRTAAVYNLKWRTDQH